MRKAAWIAVPILFGLGFVLHFAYEWCGGAPLVGAFCPVNESVWEHLKLAFFPPVLFWFFWGRKTRLPLAKRLVAAAVSACAASLVVLAIHYTVSGATGREIMAADIASLAIGLAAGQYLALKALKLPMRRWMEISAAAALMVVGLMLIAFTHFPPHIPLFWDAEGGFYGTP